MVFNFFYTSEQKEATVKAEESTKNIIEVESGTNLNKDVEERKNTNADSDRSSNEDAERDTSENCREDNTSTQDIGANVEEPTNLMGAPAPIFFKPKKTMETTESNEEDTTESNEEVSVTTTNEPILLEDKKTKEERTSGASQIPDQSSIFQFSYKTKKDDASSYSAQIHQAVNFDKNPTELFLHVKQKDWASVVTRCQEFPNEARIWVTRYEVDGKALRWRLLPIHIAVTFNAPEDTIKQLLEAYPKGAQSKDDQGMLPLHLSFRHGTTADIAKLLLIAYPQSVKVKDKRGRIPLVLAQASNAPSRKEFLKALQRGPSFYAVAAAATERAAVTSEQRALFDAKLSEMKRKHKEEADELKSGKAELETAIADMNVELNKSKSATQVLVKLVNSLEGQLSNMNESETFLSKKIVTLDNNLKKVNDHKEKMEATLQAQIDKLVEEKLMLQAGLVAPEKATREEETPVEIDNETDFSSFSEKLMREAGLVELGEPSTPIETDDATSST